jgi:hypothetical protein
MIDHHTVAKDLVSGEKGGTVSPEHISLEQVETAEANQVGLRSRCHSR